MEEHYDGTQGNPDVASTDTWVDSDSEKKCPPVLLETAGVDIRDSLSGIFLIGIGAQQSRLHSW